MPSFEKCAKHGRHGERLCALCMQDGLRPPRTTESLLRLYRSIQAECVVP